MLNPSENNTGLLAEIGKFANRYSLGSEKGEGSKHFLRIKIPNGILTTQQFRRIAQLAGKYGRGYAEATDRQDIELHWIEADDALSIFAQLEEIGFTTDRCGQGFPGARYGDVRNIMGCTVAGVHQSEVIDASPLVKELDEFFTGNPDFADLPRKFKISISDCPLNCSAPEAYDLSFVAVRHPSGRIGFIVLVGGTTGSSPTIAQSLGVFVEPKDVITITKAIVEIYRDKGSRQVKAKARFKWLVEEWGTDKLKKAVEEKIGSPLENFRLDSLPLNDGEHVGLNPQRQNGYFYVTIPILGGILSTEKMLEISEIAEKFGSGDLRISPYQNIVIINIPERHVATVMERLEKMGYPMRKSPLRWTTIACTGGLCGKAPESPKKRAIEIVDYLEERLGEKLKDLDLRLCISGCPNGCSRHMLADIGLQGTLLTVDGKPTPGYNVYVARRLDPTAKLGKLVSKAIKSEDVKHEVEKLIINYLKTKGE